MIANIIQTTNTHTATLIIAPVDFKSADTISRKDWLCEMTLKGRKALKILRILTNGRFTLLNVKSIIEVSTMRKSS